jgi:hypothetical protein
MSSTTTTENIVRRFVRTASVYVPQVPKPKKKISLAEKFVWTGIALFAYLVMAQIPLYGVTDDPRFDFLHLHVSSLLLNKEHLWSLELDL